MVDENKEAKKCQANVILASILTILLVLSLGIVFLTGCQFLPALGQDVEQIATDTAIKVEISREAMQKETNVTLDLNIINKDQPK